MIYTLPSASEPASSWVYLYVHHGKMDMVDGVLKKNYRTFVHRSVTYRLVNKKRKKVNYCTVGGLLFVQGMGKEVQAELRKYFFDQNLRRDCASGQVAVIPDGEMQLFMKISQMDATRIRFMPHMLDYYKEGHPLVEITSGVLKGVEGYRIRVNRDRCLVTTLGGMTICIGGIHRETFENVEDYARQRKEMSQSRLPRPRQELCAAQREMDKFFFRPDTELDVAVIAKQCEEWTTRARTLAAKGRRKEAACMAAFMLEEVGFCFLDLADEGLRTAFRQMLAPIRQANAVLLDLRSCEATPADLRETISAQLSSLKTRFPYLGITSGKPLTVSASQSIEFAPTIAIPQRSSLDAMA